uniref:Uncharacterized protein n=1 Tax=Arundo donax TaxID=35708 RepID=A0A0A8Y186_ARUDO
MIYLCVPKIQCL